MPEVVHYFKENYPKVKIEILDGNYDEIREWIIRGQVDCGFLSSIVADDLKFYPLWDDPLCAVFPEGHPLAAQPSVTLPQLFQYPLIIETPGCDNDIQHLMLKCPVKPNIAYSFRDDTLIMAFVRSGLGVIILAGCMLASVAYGSNLIPIGQVLQALQNPDSGTFEATVVWARIPRTVFGVLAGAALGVSGALMQAVTRNPIADPSVLGVNTGASLFVVVGIAWIHITSSQRYIWLAFAGAALTAAFVYGIASVGYGGPTSIKLALAGTAIGTALSAFVNTIMLPDSSVMKEFRFWQVGSISGKML